MKECRATLEQRREKSRVKIEDFLEFKQLNSLCSFVSFVVKSFFRKAPPDADSPDAMYKVMRAEILKWHPDRIKLHCGTAPSEDEYKKITMISIIVNDLRSESNKKRSREV